jgi:opacity protein-like surface antigen
MSFYKNINKLAFGFLVYSTLFSQISIADYGIQKPKTEMDKENTVETRSLGNSKAETSYSSENNEKSFYVGARGGFSMPLSKTMDFETRHEVQDKDLKNKAHLKGSGSFEFHFGHFIAPTTTVEFSYMMNPKYSTNIVLDDKLGSTDTKVKLQTFMVNFNYDFQDIGVTPYFTIGTGLAKVDLEPSKPVIHPLAGSIFEVRKTKNNAFGFQVGLGIKKMLTDNVGLNFCANTIIIPNVVLKIKKFNFTKGGLEDSSMKKSFGVFNLTAGIDLNF